jgi:hypothetical protein
MRGRRVLGVAITTALVMTAAAALATSRPQPYGSGSYWNTEVPDAAPSRAKSSDIMGFLAQTNTPDYVRLAGTSSDGQWGLPIYSGGSDSKTYDVRDNCSLRQPSEFAHVRIPAGANPDRSSDAAMVVYNRDRGLVFGFWHARHDDASDTWSACGGTVSYLGSNGLDGKLAASDQAHNIGHRGLPPPMWAVRYPEIRNGAINHVLKIAVHTTGCAHVFPMVGDECGTRAPHAPPEGTRIRIKPSVSLRKLHLSPAALIIARALKRYGAIISDQSSGSVNLKVENTIAEGRGWLWKRLLGPDALRAIPLSDFEVVG